MARNQYFNQYSTNGEQNLLESLLIESIKIYGFDCMYLPRTLVKEDHLFSEDVLSTFDNAYEVEMYVKSVDGFEGDGDFLSKFGLEIRDEMTLTVAQKRFRDEVTNTTENIDRPSEGDLIVFPLNNKIYEVKFVEHEAIFYQLGKLYTWDLKCELWEYSHERLETGIDSIDSIEDRYSGDVLINQILLEDGSELVTESGNFVILDMSRSFDRIVTETQEFLIDESGNYFTLDESRLKTDYQANNQFFTSEHTRLDMINWNDTMPFGEAVW